MIQVLLVEDDPMARQLLEIYVNKSETYELAGWWRALCLRRCFAGLTPWM